MAGSDTRSPSGAEPRLHNGVDGARAWYLDGQLHREDGPAIEWASGRREWFLHGQLHRADGPAVQYADGTEEWWLTGSRHRTDGPAIVYASGTRHWYLNGSLHRIDGPAVEECGGARHWAIHDHVLEKELARQWELSSIDARETAASLINDGMEPDEALATAQRILA